MRLIEEIEAPRWRLTDTDCIMLPYSRWLDIKAALLAGEEMRQLLWDARAPQAPSPEMWLSLRTLADNRFRAATEGTKQGESDGRC